MKKLIIIQSRVDSNRLPGKALLEIKGKPTLQHVIERCNKGGTRTIVATTSGEVDDPIEAICLALNVTCYRYTGGVNDVLGRYYYACLKEKLKSGADRIVRVTADCLGIEAVTINEVLAQLRNHDYAYASPEAGYPNGYGCEAFTFRALREAQHRAVDSYDREHVTPYIQRSFVWAPLGANRYDGFNMELNTEEDYQRIKNIYENM